MGGYPSTALLPQSTTERQISRVSGEYQTSTRFSTINEKYQNTVIQIFMRLVLPVGMREPRSHHTQCSSINVHPSGRDVPRRTCSSARNLTPRVVTYNLPFPFIFSLYHSSILAKLSCRVTVVPLIGIITSVIVSALLFINCDHPFSFFFLSSAINSRNSRAHYPSLRPNEMRISTSRLTVTNLFLQPSRRVFNAAVQFLHPFSTWFFGNWMQTID